MSLFEALVATFFCVVLGCGVTFFAVWLANGAPLPERWHKL